MSWFIKICQKSSEDIRNELYSINKILNTEISNQKNELIKTPVNTYYEQAVIDYKCTQLSISQSQQWLEILKSKLPEIQSTNDATFINLVQKEISNVEQSILNMSAESMPNKAETDAYFDKDVFEFYADGDTNINEHLIPLMDLNNVSYDFYTFPTGKEILIVEIGRQTYVVEQSNNQIYYDEAESWIESASENPEEYYGENVNENFWESVGPGSILYHMTSNEYLSSIRKRGLQQRDKTRGLSNRSTGPAVFTSENSEEIEVYGDTLIEIDVWKMKQDGYMPDAEREEVVNEAEIKNALAHAIGLDDYQAEHDSDISPTTIIIYGPIPPKYLRFPMQ